jgi:LDH2 family malate/lactate/ureidoglycolate dehydrogenase
MQTAGWLVNGVFVMALKIEAFVPLNGFEARVDALVNAIRNSPRAEGFEQILIPGEPEIRERERRLKNGIPISDRAWQSLMDTCKEYGLDVESPMRV